MVSRGLRSAVRPSSTRTAFMHQQQRPLCGGMAAASQKDGRGWLQEYSSIASHSTPSRQSRGEKRGKTRPDDMATSQFYNRNRELDQDTSATRRLNHVLTIEVGSTILLSHEHGDDDHAGAKETSAV